MWIDVWVADRTVCDPSLTRANLNALEINIAHTQTQ